MSKFAQSSVPIDFEGFREKMYYERIAFRAPRRGEFYLSGAIVQAWRAPNDLTTRYHIVRPTHYAKLAYVRGNRFQPKPERSRP